MHQPRVMAGTQVVRTGCRTGWQEAQVGKMQHGVQPCLPCVWAQAVHACCLTWRFWSVDRAAPGRVLFILAHTWNTVLVSILSGSTWALSG